MANEPRSYREAIAEVFGGLRPKVAVITVDTVELDGGVVCLAPDVVICSRATDIVRERVPVWVELYSKHGSRSMIGVRGKLSTVEDMQLSDLPFTIDRAERIAHST